MLHARSLVIQLLPEPWRLSLPWLERSSMADQSEQQWVG